MAIDLPTSTPRALVEGHTQQEADIGETCEFERGEARRAPIYRSVPNVVNLRWPSMTQEQFDDFMDWFERDLLAGSLPANLQVAEQGSSAAVVVEAMFLEPPQCRALAGGRWGVSVRCITGVPFESTLPSGDTLDDIAMVIRLEPWRETAYANNDRVVSATNFGAYAPLYNFEEFPPGLAPVYKTGVVNGQAVYRFGDGENRYLSSPPIPYMAGTASRWYCVVKSYRALTAQVAWLGFHSQASFATNQGESEAIASAQQFYRFSAQGSDLDDRYATLPSVNEFHLNTMFADGSTVSRTWGPGLASHSIAQPGTDFDVGDNYQLILGAGRNAGTANHDFFADVDFALVFAGDVLPTTSQRVRILAYIQSRLGVSA